MFRELEHHSWLYKVYPRGVNPGYAAASPLARDGSPNRVMSHGMPRKTVSILSLVLFCGLGGCSGQDTVPDEEDGGDGSAGNDDHTGESGMGGAGAADEAGARGGLDDAGDVDAGEPDAGARDPNSFSTIFDEIIVPKCSGPLCHSSAAVGGNLPLTMAMDASVARDLLVDQSASGGECASSGATLVVPGEPDQSLIYLKLLEDPPCGTRMPVIGPLSDDEVARIRRWIEDGAPAP